MKNNLPKHFTKYLEMAESHPFFEYHSPESANKDPYAEEIIRESFGAARVEIRVDDFSDDQYDNLRKRAYVTLDRSVRDLADFEKVLHTTETFVMDVSPAIWLAAKVRRKELGRPYVTEYMDEKTPMVSVPNKNRRRRIAEIIKKMAYPNAGKQFVYVDGETRNLCNWNLYPMPFVSFFDRMRWDGKYWYLKLRVPGTRYGLKAKTEGEVLDMLMEEFSKYGELLSLDSSPRERDLFGNGDRISDYVAILERLKDWSPTKTLEPWTQDYRREQNMWSLEA